MKLLNHTLKYLVFLFPFIIAIWAGLFYYNMVDEVQDSIDDGLENYKILIVKHAHKDPSILNFSDFQEKNYSIQPIDAEMALRHTDVYSDTMMYLLSESDYEPVRMLTSAFKFEDKYYQLRVISTNLEHDDLIEQLFNSIIWLYITLLISVLVINNWVLRKTWKPFYSILKNMKGYSLEKKSAYEGVNTKVYEFKELDSTFRELIKRIEEVYMSQKQFLENASHEIQTPLAISMNKIELLLEQDNLTKEDYPKIIQIYKSLERLSRLNKSLLLINKIENRHYVEMEKIQMVDFVDQLLEDFSEIADLKGKSFQVIYTPDFKKENFEWEMNRDLVHILFNNLLKNALAHSPEDSQILIEWNSNEVRIKNKGSQGLDINRVFERFYKESPDPERSGLGLAISKAICEVSQLQLNYSFVGNYHVFSLKK